MYKTEFIIDNGALDCDIEIPRDMPYKVEAGEVFIVDIYEDRQLEEGGDFVSGYYPIKIKVAEVHNIIGRCKIKDKNEVYEDDYIVMAFCDRL